MAEGTVKGKVDERTQLPHIPSTSSSLGQAITSTAGPAAGLGAVRHTNPPGVAA
jgi:hypothetical protein